MSRFFKALEQAEQERALREQARGAPASVVVAPPAPEEPEELLAPAPPPQAVMGPSDRAGVAEHLVSLLAPASFEAEQYRSLRYFVEQLHKTADLSVLAISSPAAGDGKTITAINLAGALAQAPEARILLVDADLRRSSLAKQLGLLDGDHRGLVDAILDSTLALDAVVRERPPFNLWVLPAGRQPAAPYEVLKSPRLGELLEQARRDYDFVVLDTPPLVSVPDCRVIGKWVDGFLVVVAAHKTPRRLLEEALNVTDPAKIVGLVFNVDDHPLSGYSAAYVGPSFNGNAHPHWGKAVKRVRKIGGSVGGHVKKAGGTVRRRLGGSRAKRPLEG